MESISELNLSTIKRFWLQNWRIIVGIVIGVVLLCSLSAMIYRVVVHSKELKASQLIEDLRRQEHEDMTKSSYLEFNYRVDLTDSNQKAKDQMMEDQEKNRAEASERASEIDYTLFLNETLKEELQRFIGKRSLPMDKLKRFTSLVDTMEDTQANTEICPINENDAKKCTLGLDDASQILENEKSSIEEKKHVWVQYHNLVGHKLRPVYPEYVQLLNENARINEFKDGADSWNEDMGLDNFRAVYANLYHSLEPLYLQLHAYVRFKLRQKYGDVVSQRGPIPIHLLGDMYAQSWTAIKNFSLPYPNEQETDVTKEMLKQGYTVPKMFQMAESFFVSMNLSYMTKKFTEKSMFVKPKSPKKVVCHAAAWDFYTQDDFRISMCAHVGLSDFVTIHHEMGHIQYFMEYRIQPKVEDRTGANSGFHEAIGDMIAASVQSLKHLKKVGLFHTKIKQETIINQLYVLSLFQVAFLPFSYLTDVWRWDVFEGKVLPKDYNCHWWHLKYKYQGVEPPVNRDTEDFDPVSKYHVAADVAYIRYFVAMVLQYQFLKSLCKIAGEFEDNNPNKLLSECDLYGHKNAGNALKKMLALGASKPWPDALEVLTDQREMDISGLLQYFKPLYDWLIRFNRENGVYVGWQSSKINVRCG